VSEPLAHEFVRASGASVDDCSFVAHRYREADGCFKPAQGESFVCSVTEGRARVEFGGPGWITGLWRAPGGTLYACDAAGRVFVRAGLYGPWQHVDLPGTLLGVWGLDAAQVWVWGTRGEHGVMYRFDGAGWAEVESPGHVVALHGTERDLLFAVGHQGLIARWNGVAWQRMASPVCETLHGVFAVSKEEAFAVGPSGVCLDGSEHGWMLRERRDHLLYCVAAFRGGVYAGAPCPEGLLSRGPAGTLETVDHELSPYQIDARGALLLANPYVLTSSTDAKQWARFEVAAFEGLVAGRPFAAPR